MKTNSCGWNNNSFSMAWPGRAGAILSYYHTTTGVGSNLQVESLVVLNPACTNTSFNERHVKSSLVVLSGNM